MPTRQVIDFVPGRTEIAGKPDQSSPERTMLPLLAALIRTVATSSITSALVGWAGKLVTRAVARQLQVPEALVHLAGLYLYAQIDTFERQLLHSVLGKNFSKSR
jgi:hypothetical protein